MPYGPGGRRLVYSLLALIGLLLVLNVVEIALLGR